MYGYSPNLISLSGRSATRCGGYAEGVGRAVYVDCFSGASGDMLLGALVDAGVPAQALSDGLARLPIRGWSLTAERVHRQGLTGTQVKVVAEQGGRQPHRGLSDILEILAQADLDAGVLERAVGVFRTLAEVEATIHGTSVDQVEFHEVGALDAIVDIVGSVLGLSLLNVDWQRVTCSALPLGSGWVNAAHGRLPIPAPATLELMRRAGAPTRAAPVAGDVGELTTPTGAALLTTLASFPARPDLGTVDRIGYGFGTRQPPWPNAVRVVVGPEVAVPMDLIQDQVAEIETNLDDATPEELGFAMERLLESGALDVAFSPLQMKKNRPGTLVRVLGRPSDGPRLIDVLLTHTSALGARTTLKDRLIARRAERTVATPWGNARVKLKLLGERQIAAPEYEDCARLARDSGVPLRDIYEAARRAAFESVS